MPFPVRGKPLLVAIFKIEVRYEEMWKLLQERCSDDKWSALCCP
jgi:hypothetical protein